MSASLSVKPDKCAILQETVNQIRRIKQEEENIIQQGEVSSSTNILANEILCPLVLEALDGFLFVVNTEGRVEYVSENVESFISWRNAELRGGSIYNVIHVGDHARFAACLNGGGAGGQGTLSCHVEILNFFQNFELF
jgi:nuclear receptor coactivator 2